jgi:N6-L-threonylcarbamoyladenine synthase
MILAIDTSCDETSASVTDGRKALSNELYSQVLEHEKWGGVMPLLAKRAHEERIDGVIERALKKAHVTVDDVDAIAVTYGPGLAIALGVGINKAKELAEKHNKRLIAVNHMEGHIYSCFVQNSKGNPDFPFEFPYLAVLVSGSHTELVLFKDHLNYEVIGETLDDAAGEALDKGARMILNEHFYPGGPVIEKLARSGNKKAFPFPRPMMNSKDLHFSYSGLKTSLLYLLKTMTNKERIEKINDLAASYQEAVFQSIFIKLERAMDQYSINRIIVGGGVSANEYLRKCVRQIVHEKGGLALFPADKKLNGDNAAMIGVAAFYKAQKKIL